MDELDGVWRTMPNGTKVFIKKGQSLSKALKTALSNNEIKQNKINCLNIKLKEVEDELEKVQNNSNHLFGNSELNKKEDELIDKKAKIKKMILDEKAKSDKSYIQDKELRDFIYDYTAGDYGTAVTYTQYIADGYDEKEALKRIKNHSHDDSYFENQVRLAKKLQNEINKSEYDMPLIRFEKTQMRSDFYGNLSNDQKEYKVGEELKWGIRSASSNENYFEKIASGNDKISLEHFASAYPYTYTEYKILGKKNL